ncbi:hypothetical protein ASPCAL13398 [Aspergillus calidoustus]|uniref:ABM domain-containing protein n=1 Tax=Aspergillus calidoustus TaxID=454130 RepID=A0A0U5GEZ4_ASPCI|nr:hypothetical protein ASPCAL13398 [Aspergillus calidoustus]
MTPITRSSARQRTKQKDLSLPTSRSIRNPRAEKNAPANRFLVQSAAPEPAITNTAQEFHQGPVIEWILIKILEDSNPEAKERRKVAQRALLKEIRRQEGCEFVATGKPLKSESEWVIIQWRSRTDRDELIASTKPGRALKELLEQRAVSTNLISRSQGPPLNRSQFFDPPRYYEIMTAAALVAPGVGRE